MRYWFWMILAMSCGQLAELQAQQSWYSGPAVWIPREGATEKFQHARRDTNLQLTGKYQWQFKEQLASGELRLVNISTQFKNGKIDGALQFAQYVIHLEVADFALDQIETQARGSLSSLQAYFQAGKPMGQWQLEAGPYPRQQEGGLKIIFSPVLQQLEWQQGNALLNGRISSQGIVDGLWKWQADSTSYFYSFQAGQLQGLRTASDSLAVEAFKQVHRSILAEPKLHWQVDTASVYDPGLWAGDSILLLQQPWKEAFSSVKQQMEGVWGWINQHPLIQLPALPVLQRPYIPLDSTLLPAHSYEMVARLHDSLDKCLHAPLMQLRVGMERGLDSVYELAMAAQLYADSILEQYSFFKSPHSRYRLAQAHFGDTAGILNHAAWVAALQTAAVQHLPRMQSLIEALNAFRQQFKEEAALEALEEAWLSQMAYLRDTLKPQHPYAIGLQLWQNFQQGHLQKQKEAYTALSELQARRQFLRAAIDELEGLIRYFEQRSYPFLTTAPDDFQKAYTQMLYNPYMGVNNIEQVNRRRLLSYFKVDFWPWWCEQLLLVERPQQLFEEQETAKLLYEAIMLLGTDASREADRLEKRIRREKSPERVVRLLLDYQRRHEGRAQSGSRLISGK